MSDSNSSPDRPGIGSLLGGSLASGSPVMFVVMVLTLTTIMGGPSSPQPTPPATAKKDGETKTEASSGNGTSELANDRTHGDKIAALTPLWTYLGINAKDLADRGEGRLDQIPAVMKKINRAELTVLIATLPDPLDTGSKFEFDMGLEAVQKAIESEGYILDRFENPWSTGSSKQAGAGVGAEHYRNRPACLLFRSGDAQFEFAEKSNLTVLLIVGESPTWGIQKGAFETSLDIAGELTVPDATGRRTVKVIGPTYSGTAASLGATLSKWLADYETCNAWVCSGSATSVSKKDFEALATPPTVGPESSVHRVIYTSTVLPDEVLLDEVLRYLASPASPPDVIPTEPLNHTVLLVEGGTLYGNRFFRYFEQFSQRKRIGCSFIPFPRRISQLRGIPELTQGFELSVQQKSTAAIPLAEKGERLEIFPSFDPDVTGPNDSLVLKNILATIANEDVRYVGVLASEVRNVLFLVKLINRYCPDVQIFLINNDVMFSGEDFSADFYGTIIASTYPLDSRSPLWSFPGTDSMTRRLFSNEIDIGRYNASLVLMNGEVDPLHGDRLILNGQAEDMLVYGPPFEDAGVDSKTTTRKFAKRRPCVWINVVGKDSIWPVRTVSIKDLEMRAAQVFKPVSAKYFADASSTGARAINADVTTLRNGFEKRGLATLDRLERAAAELARKGMISLAPAKEDKSTVSSNPGLEKAEEESVFNTLFPEPLEDQESQLPWLITKKATDLGSKRASTLLRNGDKPASDLTQYVKELRTAFRDFARCSTGSDRHVNGANDLSRDRVNAELFALFHFQIRLAALKSLFPDGNVNTSTAGNALSRLENDAQIFWMICAVVGKAEKNVPVAVTDLETFIAEQRRLTAGHLRELWQLTEDLEATAPSSSADAPTRSDDKQVVGNSPPIDSWAHAHVAVMDAIYSQHIALINLVRYRVDKKDDSSSRSSNKSISTSRASDEQANLAKLGQEWRTDSLALDGAINWLENLERSRIQRTRDGGQRSDEDETRSHVISSLRHDFVSVTSKLLDIKWALANKGERDDKDLWYRVRVAQLQKQADESKALIPAVLDVARQIEDIVVTAPASGTAAQRERVIVAFTELVPLIYCGVMVAWMCLAGSLIYRVLQTNTSVRPDQRRSFDAFAITAGGRRRFFVILTALALAYVTTLAVARPLLIVALHCFKSLWSPSILVTGFGGTLFCMILFFGFVALSSGWLVYKRSRLELKVAGASIGVRRAVCGSMVLGWLIVFIVPPFICLAFPQSIHQEMLTSNRALHLGNGVSPVLTTLLLGGLLLLWCLFGLDYGATCQQLPAPSQRLKARADLVWPDEDTRQSPWVRTVRHVLRQFDELCWVERHSSVIPFPEPAVAPVNQKTGIGKLLAGIVQMPVIPIVVVLAVSLAVVVVGSSFGFPVKHFRGRFTPTPEGPLFDTCIVLALLLYLTIYLLMFFRLALIWWKLRDLLITLDSLPWGASLARMPAKVSGLFGRFMGFKSHSSASSDAPDPTDVIERQYAQAVARALTANGELGEEELATSVTRHLATFDRPRPNRDALIQTLVREAHGVTSAEKVSVYEKPYSLMWACLPFVTRAWDVREPREIFGAGVAGGGGAQGAGPSPSIERDLAEPIVKSGENGLPTSGGEGNVGTQSVQLTSTLTRVTTPAADARAGGPWLQLAEDYVLISLIFHLRRFAPPLRKLASFLMTSPVILLLAITLYPFQPQRMLTMLIWILVLGAASLSIWIFIQIDRDPFVSRVSNTTPNAVNFDVSFISSLMPLLVPVLGLILTLFPDLQFFMRSVLEPVARAIK